MDLKHLVFVVFRHKYKIIAFVLSALLMVVVSVRIKGPIYEATAQILVKLGREISAPTQDIIGRAGLLKKRTQDILAEVEILESRFLLEKVVRELGHDRIISSDQQTEDESPFETAVISIKNELEIEPSTKSDTIKITYANPNPDLANEVLSTFLDKYLERHVEVHKGSSMQEFFQPQTESHKKKLEEIEKQLGDFKSENNLFMANIEKTELLQQNADIRVELEKTQREILEKIGKIKRLNEQIATQSQIVELPELEDQNPVIDTLRRTLVGLESQKQQLLGQYSSASRTVVNIDSVIQKVKEQLSHEQSRVLFTNQKELAVLRQRAKVLNETTKRYLSELKKLDSAEIILNRLERERQMREQNYLLYVKQLEQARISEAMDLAKITNVRVIQPVAVSTWPVGPGISLILILTMGISLLISITIVVLFEYIDHSVSTVRDVERYLNLPVLGSIREEG